MTKKGKELQKQEQHGAENFSMPYPVSRMAPPYTLVDLAKEIAHADDMLSVQANGKLQVLAEQIRLLQGEAEKILQETRKNQELHRAVCSLSKKVGQVYHFYRRGDGCLVLSLLSPEEWKQRCPGMYEGAYRLEHDMTWSDATDMF